MDELLHKRADLLHEAEVIVCNDREGQYGKPEDSFSRIAEYWSVYLQRSIKAEDVAVMMTLFKIARIQTGISYKADSWVDAIGYLACGGEIAGKQCGV